MYRVLGALILTLILVSSAEARSPQRAYLAHPDCNVVFPCEGVAPSARGERIVKAMGGFGSAQKVYTPRVAKADARHNVRERKPSAVPLTAVARVSPTVVAHPPGCPSRAFCGCGAAVRVFGSPVRSLWLAANWFKFPRSAPAPGMVAVRSHHVFVLEAHLGGDTWQVYDANSGGHATRIHARSISGYVIVNPRGAA